MKECKNYFVNTIERGNFTIENGIINAKDKYLIGQYILIFGSILNDGVYLVNDDLITLENAIDETFTGIVCGLRVPRDFVDIVHKINEFDKSKKVKDSDVVSASFGIQSMSFATDKNGLPVKWQTLFADDLNKYRRMTPDINLGGVCHI